MRNLNLFPEFTILILLPSKFHVIYYVPIDLSRCVIIYLSKTIIIYYISPRVIIYCYIHFVLCTLPQPLFFEMGEEIYDSDSVISESSESSETSKSSENTFTPSVEEL